MYRSYISMSKKKILIFISIIFIIIIIIGGVYLKMKHDEREKQKEIYYKEQQERIFENTANEMQGTTLEVQHRHIRHCYKADSEYGKGVAKALGIDINDVDLEVKD